MKAKLVYSFPRAAEVVPKIKVLVLHADWSMKRKSSTKPSRPALNDTALWNVRSIISDKCNVFSKRKNKPPNHFIFYFLIDESVIYWKQQEFKCCDLREYWCKTIILCKDPNDNMNESILLNKTCLMFDYFKWFDAFLL